MALLQQIESAIFSHKLVVVSGELIRAVYWQSQLLQTRWEGRSVGWELILRLAELGSRGMKLEPRNLSGEVTLRKIANRRNNLKRFNWLPEELVNLIKTCEGMVELALPREDIMVIKAGKTSLSFYDLPGAEDISDPDDESW
ncbi:MAG: hypothetical protein FWD61_12140 [Phycisphaerales bacterium]|nr:hypothetical protein [Phycisphaerales bacterium]